MYQIAANIGSQDPSKHATKNSCRGASQKYLPQNQGMIALIEVRVSGTILQFPQELVHERHSPTRIASTKDVEVVQVVVQLVKQGALFEAFFFLRPHLEPPHSYCLKKLR